MNYPLTVDNLEVSKVEKLEGQEVHEFPKTSPSGERCSQVQMGKPRSRLSWKVQELRTLKDSCLCLFPAGAS